MYTYWSRKYFLCSFLFNCEFTRDKFFIHAKCLTSLSFCTYSKLTCLSLFISASHIRKISFLFSILYILISLRFSNFFI